MVPRESSNQVSDSEKHAPPASAHARLGSAWWRFKSAGGWALILLMAAGVILSGLLYHNLKEREAEEFQSSFLRRAERQRMLVATSLQEHCDSILVLEGLFRFSKGVERNEFRGSANLLLQRYKGVHAFQWAPHVTAEERPEVEQMAREEGISNYEIKEPGPAGAFVRAGERPVYFPVLYTEPREGNEVMFGFDLAMGPNRDALERAWKTGRITGGDPITLAQERSGQLGWILICPVYHSKTDLSSPESRAAGLRGYLQGVFRMPTMFSTAWKPLQNLGLETLVLDVTPGTRQRLIYATAGRADSQETPPGEQQVRAGLHAEHRIDIAGRNWLLLTRPDPGWQPYHPTLYPELLCLGGLIITTLLGAYIHLVRTRAQEVGELVARRTLELAESRDSLQLALEAANMGTWEWEIARDRMHLSPSMERLHAIPEGSFPGKMENWIGALALEDQARLRTEIAEARERGADLSSEYRIAMPEGGRRWLSLKARTFREKAGRESLRIIGAARDITQQKEAEEEIHRHLASEREARLRAETSEQMAEEAVMLLNTIFQTAPVGLAFLDSNLRFARVNASLAAINGVPIEAHLGRTLKEMNPVVAAQVDHHHREVMASGKPVVNLVLKGPKQTPEGPVPGTWISSYYPIKRPHGEVYGLGVVVIDITELRRAEEREQRLAAVVEQSSDVVLILTPTGRTVYANGVFCRQSGIPADRVVGMEVEQLTKALGVENRFDLVLKRIATDGIWTDRIHTMSSSDRQQLAFDYTISPLRDEAGAVTDLVVVGRDVTRELVLEDRLRTSQKMEAVGLLAGGIAHDFNNLLQVIEGYTALCLDLPCSPDELTQNLQQVREAASRAAQLTKQLLLFSRRQPLARTELDLHELTANILKMIGRLIGPQIEVALEAAEAISAVQADRGQLEQVLLNLCVNARDAMPNGGRIVIELQDVELDGAESRQYPDLQPGRYVRLRVSDNGSGMSSAMRARIFEPFFTTKPSGHGTGLGLSVVYGIVQQHEGAVSVESTEGRGTTFNVLLPALHKRATPRSPVEALQFSRGSETVLLVEDEDPVRQLTSIVLRQAGYEVLEAADGQEACEIFAARKNEIGLVLMDVMMPRMGGLEAWKRIRAMRDVPVLFCSGYTGAPGDLPEGVPLLPKPFTSDKLLASIRDLLDTRAAKTHSPASAE